MKHRVALIVSLLLVCSVVASAVAGPIIKPRKYHGPIPRSSLTLRFGFLGGATNEEMLDYFDRRVPDPVRNETVSNDFGNAPLAELAYMYKAHPQFAVRASVYAAYLTSDWQGTMVPPIEPPDTVGQDWQAPSVLQKTTFDILLFTGELSAVYYFTDAAVNEFQPYVGGGFSFGVPYQKLKTKETVRDPDDDPDNPDYTPIYRPGDTYLDVTKDTWSFEAGVHGLVGALYYFGSRWAISLEGRLQILQSRFPLNVTNEVGEPEEVDFVVDYSGFMLTAGISYAF
jgi:hypothetical protein